MMKNYLKNFWLYAAGRFVSLIGSGVQYLALSLYILDITGSGTMMGTFLVVSMLPRVIFAPFAGVVGDRFNRKKIMVYLDFARGVLIFLLAFIAYKGMLSLVVIYISQLLISTLDIFFDPATGAMVPDIVPKEKLTRANSILGSINSFSYIIGPAVGGILYPLGIGIVFILNASSFIASGISEMFIEYKQTTEKKKMTASNELPYGTCIHGCYALFRQNCRGIQQPAIWYFKFHLGCGWFDREFINSILPLQDKPGKTL